MGSLVDKSKVKDFFHLVYIEGRGSGSDGVDHNKIYDGFLLDGKCVCTWGRATNDYTFGDLIKQSKEYPISDFEKIKRSKIAKGYSDMSHLYKSFNDPNQKTGDSNSPVGSSYKDIEDASVKDVLGYLYSVSNKVVKKNYTINPGLVTEAMIKEAQYNIDAIAGFAKNAQSGNTAYAHALQSHVLDLWKVIPRGIIDVDATLSSIVRRSPSELESYVVREQSLLDSLKGVMVTTTKGQKLSNANHTWLELNNLEMSPATEKDIALIKRKLGADVNRFSRAWCVTNNHQKNVVEAFRKEQGLYKRDSKLLWHGTRTENVLSILKECMQIRPAGAVLTGHMWGLGLYHAPLAHKSLGYTSLPGAYWVRSGNLTKGYMFLNEVVVGKSFDAYTFSSKYSNYTYSSFRRDNPGCLSLYAHAGASLRNDEVIVYKSEQVQPVYLVELV